MVGPRLGLFNQQLAPQTGDRVDDELATVIGMKAANHERKMHQHISSTGISHNSEIGGVAATIFPLRHFVHGLDPVDVLYQTPKLTGAIIVTMRQFLLFAVASAAAV